MAAAFTYLFLLAFSLQLTLADEAAASQNCPRQVDGLKTDGRGSLMQVAQRTNHPGAGQAVVLQDPEAEVVSPTPSPSPENLRNSNWQDPLSYFTVYMDGLPMDGGEFHQMPIFEEPDSKGSGSLLVLTVIFLTLVCSCLVIACLGTPLEPEETWQDKAAESRPTTRTAGAPPPRPAKVPYLALQPSLRPSQDLRPEQMPNLAPVPEDAQEAEQDVRQHGQHPEVEESLGPARSPEPLESTSQVLKAQSSAPEGPLLRPAEAAPEETSWDPPDMEAEGRLHLPPMGTAFPPWYGGATPQSALDEASATLGDEEVSETLFQQSLSLSDLADMRHDPWLWTSSDPPPPMTLCPGLIVPRHSECCLVIPIPTKERSAIFVIVFGTDGQPLLRAEVYRGHNCAPPIGSPMTSVHWPPASASMARNDQHASVVLTTLPPEMRRTGNVSADEEPEILSTGYLVRGSDGMEMDIVDGDGRFFGRLGRDPDRRSRYCLRSGEHGETRIYCDGVYEDFALLLTDEMQEVLGEVEAFNPANAPFSEAVGCICMRVSGSRDGVDAGLMLAIYFGVYELHWGLSGKA